MDNKFHNGFCLVEVIRGIEGPCLVIGRRRVAGPKPWSGGTVLYSFGVSAETLIRAVKEETDAHR